MRTSILKLFLVLGILLPALTACGDDERQQQQIQQLPPDDNPFELPPEPPPVIQLPPEPAPPPPASGPARLMINPTQLTFPATRQGRQSVRAITLSNTGESVLTLTTVRLSPETSEIRRSGGTCATGMALEAGRTCDITIIFSPSSAAAENYEASLVIAHTASNMPEFITIRGRSELAVTDVPGPAPVVPAPERILTRPAAPPPPEYLNALEVARLRTRARSNVLSHDVPGTEDRYLQDISLDYGDIGHPPTRSTLPVDRSLMITADRYIPVVLENTISSQIDGGRVVGVVERNVYGADNRFILVPAGTRVIGTYTSVGNTQSKRIQIGWGRMIRPDGVAINVDSPTADMMGRMGAIGHLDRRLLERLSFDLLRSIIEAAGVYYTASDNQLFVRTPGDANSQTESVSEETAESQAFNTIREDMQETLDQIASEFRSTIQPVLTVPAGTRLLILPQTDLIFAKPTLLTAANFDALVENYARLPAGGAGAYVPQIPEISRPPAQPRPTGPFPAPEINPLYPSDQQPEDYDSLPATRNPPVIQGQNGAALPPRQFN